MLIFSTLISTLLLSLRLEVNNESKTRLLSKVYVRAPGQNSPDLFGEFCVSLLSILGCFVCQGLEG